MVASLERPIEGIANSVVSPKSPLAPTTMVRVQGSEKGSEIVGLAHKVEHVTVPRLKELVESGREHRSGVLTLDPVI